MSIKRDDIIVYDGVTKMFVHPMLNDEGDVKEGFSVDYREILSDNAIFENTIHCHEYIEIELLVYGNATHLVNGSNVQIKKGYIDVMRRSDFHSFHIPKGEKVCFYYAAFNEDKIPVSLYNRLTLHKGTIDCFLDENSFKRFVSLFQIMREAYIDWNEGSEEIIKSVIQTILVVLLNKHVENNEDSGYAEIVRRAMLYIEKHFLEPDCSLTMVSSNINVTPNYLGKLIKKSVGMSFSQYCTWRKLSYSIQLLENRMLSIREIAEKAGFSSSSYYISIFRKHYGVTPQKFIMNKGTRKDNQK